MDFSCEYGAFEDVFTVSNIGLKHFFQNYSFLYVEDELNISQYEKIYQNIKNSPFIIINGYQYKCNQIENLYFIIFFEQTIIIANHSSLFHLADIFSHNTNLKICFLSNNESIFHQKIDVNYQKFECNSFILKHAENFCENFLLCQTAKASIKKIWPSISLCISVYLIKQSLSKLNKSRFENFDYKNENKNLKTIKKDDYVKLISIGVGSVFSASLIYYLDSKELLILKSQIKDEELNEIEKLVEREKENYSKLHHPLLPKFYGITQRNYGIITEYIQGQTLENIKKLQLNEVDKINIIFQLIMVFEYLHYNNFIYRDLKPNNVMIDENKTVVLIDFDRMINFDNVSIYSTFTNDFASYYVAPELSNNNLSYKCDIYSLGLIIYYILSEKEPNHKNKSEIIALFKKYDRIGQIFKECINENPEKRPTIYQLIIEFYIKYCNSITDEHLLEYFRKYVMENSELFQYRTILISTNINYYEIGLDYYYGSNLQKDINKSIYYLSLASDQNNVKAQFKLGTIYHNSDQIEPNISKAIKYYTLAANQNHPYAQFNLGLIYDEAKYVKRDINEAIKYYTLAANQGISESQFKLALLYMYDKECTPNLDLAIKYLQSAHKLNHKNARCYLDSIYYCKGLMNLRYDIDKAIHYLELSAELNNKNAQFQLGSIYEDTQFYFRDLNKAIHYYILASNQNHPSAQNNLGCIFENQQNDVYNIKNAIYYYELAANQNVAESQFNLGYIYYKGEKIQRNIAKAIYYLLLAANQNYDKALYLLGNIYYKGEYVKQDIQKALSYLKLAAKLNNVNAQFLLGTIYTNGKYVTRDIEKGIMYLKKAADLKISQAQYNLGAIYFNKKEFNEVKKYFLLAAKQNNPEAQTQLGYIYYNGINCSVDINKAIHFYTLAKDQHYAEAEYQLGLIYSTKNCTLFDSNKCIYYMTRAANQNHPKALYFLGYIYTSETYGKEYIQKGINYLLLALKYNVIDAYFLIGFLYHEGKKMGKNIQKAIECYKNASSFNNNYAKNNLGIIYKNGFGTKIPKNISNAIIYFKEAIYKSNDVLSMFNLASIYIYDDNFENCIDDSIELLIKSLINNFVFSKDLLCIALVKKYNFDYEKIKQEINKYKEVTSEFANEICILIKYTFSDDFAYYKLFYDAYKDVDYCYDFEHKSALSNDLIVQKENKVQSKNLNIKPITKSFYEGFGFDMKNC